MSIEYMLPFGIAVLYLGDLLSNRRLTNLKSVSAICLGRYGLFNI